MRMPGAVWIGPTVNENPGAELAVYGLVLHIQEGTEEGTEAWQRNPVSQVSSHFLLPKAGGIRQMVDTADKAWCEVAGNAHWISVECEGRSGESLTPAQLDGAARILAWLHWVYGVPLRTADDPNAGSVDSGGLGYHAMGGVAWGNHPDCPGAPIIAQRPAIVAAAQGIVSPGQPTPPPRPPAPAWPGRYLRYPPYTSGADVRTWQTKMRMRGWTIGIDGVYGPESKAVCEQFQRNHGLGVDGIVGPVTWARTWGP